MFTGLVEEVGVIKAHSHGLLAIKAPQIAPQLKIGDSVATNGVCLTATRIEGDTFWVDYSASTRAATTIQHWRVGDRVNLEQALTLSTRLGGHLVAGHVDGVGRIIFIRPGDNGIGIGVVLPDELLRYAIPKGSITVDGISLTLVAVHSTHVELTVVPHTMAVTTLGDRREGDLVNLEADMIGKYVERLLASPKPAALSLEELVRQGFQ